MKSGVAPKSIAETNSIPELPAGETRSKTLAAEITNAVELPTDYQSEAPDSLTLSNIETESPEGAPKNERMAATDNQYLDLLSRVATGEVSPEALSEMLRKGGIGQGVEMGDKDKVVAGKLPATKDLAPIVSRASPSLPYPTTLIVENAGRNRGAQRAWSWYSTLRNCQKKRVRSSLARLNQLVKTCHGR